MKKENQKPDKLTDKAFTRLFFTSILGIVICLACLCSTTWGWYNAGQSSQAGILQSGSFDLDVSVAKNQSADAVEITDLANGKMSCALAKGTYTVVLTMTPETTVSGFCAIIVGDEEYHTDAIDIDVANSLTFLLDVAQDGTTVIFSPSWGLPAEVHVKAGETLSVGTVSGETE